MAGPPGASPPWPLGREDRGEEHSRTREGHTRETQGAGAAKGRGKRPEEDDPYRGKDDQGNG